MRRLFDDATSSLLPLSSPTLFKELTKFIEQHLPHTKKTVDTANRSLNRKFNGRLTLK